MPLTESGKKILAGMVKRYGGEKSGKKVFYASINSGRLPKAKMEGKK